MAQGPRGDLIGARRPADPEIDPPWVCRLEEGELLGHHQRRVVGEHHPAGSDPDLFGRRRNHRHEQRWVGRRDRRHVVVLREPVAVESELVSHAGQTAGGDESVSRALVASDGHEVKD